MKLTHAMIHSAGTAGCGFNAAQLRLLGVEWPPRAGWLRGLVGQEIPDGVWSAVLALKGARRYQRRQTLNKGKLEEPDSFRGRAWRKDRFLGWGI